MKIALRAVGTLAIGLLIFLTYAGYFDESVMVDVSATARPIPERNRLVAIYVSGDVGYRVALGGEIGRQLAADGIPVIGINSLGFFRFHRTVAELTRLVSEAIRRALASGHADQVVLIGHSLGADALQAGLIDLPHELRSKVRAVVLVVPTDSLYLQITPGEMLDWSEPDASTFPTLRQLTWAPLTCIYGKMETDSPCLRLSMPNVRTISLPGGHQLEWDTNAIHSALLGAINAASYSNITKISGRDHQTAIPVGPQGYHSEAG